MAKALKIAAIVVGVAAVVVTGGTALFGAAAVSAFLGVSLGTLATITAGLSLGASILGLAAGAFAKKPKIGTAGQQLEFSSDPAAGEPYVVGEAMIGESVVHEASWGDKNKYLGIVGVLSICTIQSYDGFYTDGNLTAFAGGNATGFYHDFMHLRTQLGAMPEAAALDMSLGGGMPDWSADHKISGAAASGLILVADTANGKIYSGGTPKMTHKIKGVKSYDSRGDSTNGGSGAQRQLDEATYVYSENPFVHASTYSLGRFQNNIRVIGPGVPGANIDWASFANAANVADANAWKVSGRVMSTDRKWDVMKAMCQAGGGWPIPSGSKIYALVNTPRVSLETITEADIKGKVTVPQMGIRRTRMNGAIPRYRSADHGWEIVPGNTIRNADYLAEDNGNERTREVEFALVADKGDGFGKTQAAQLVGYDIANSREKLGISLELGLVWSQYQTGDCMTINLPKHLLINQKCVVTGKTFNIARGTVTLLFMTETDEKHDWVATLAGSTTAPPTIIIPSGTAEAGTETDLQTQNFILGSGKVGLTFTVGIPAGGNSDVTISAHDRAYSDRTVHVNSNAGPVAVAAAPGDIIAAYYDDPKRLGEDANGGTGVVYQYFVLAGGVGDISPAYPSDVHPFRHNVFAFVVPAAGGSTGGGSDPGSGGGGGGGRFEDSGYL